MIGIKNCLCLTHNSFKAMEARLYINNHLEWDSIDDSGEITYRCPDTGITWQTRDPWTWLPGWGPKSLVKVED